MILRRYMVREMLATFAAVLGILMLVVIANRFAEFLAQAVDGRIERSFILELLALKCVDALVVVWPASLFTALAITLGRFGRERELLAMTAGGFGAGRLAGTVLAIGLAFAALAGTISLAAAPYTNERYEALKAHAGNMAFLSRIVARRFVHLGDDERVFYAEHISEDRGTLEHIFVHAPTGDGGDEVFSAPNARHVVTPSGERYVILEDGHRYAGTPGRRDWAIARFEHYALRVREPPPDAQREPLEALSSERLWRRALARDRGAAAELQWRVSQPILTLVLTAIAFALIAPGALRGRFEHMLTSILAYLAYVGLIIGATSAIESGDLSPAVGVWPVHVAALAAAVAVYVHRSGGGRRRRAPRRAPSSSPPRRHAA